MKRADTLKTAKLRTYMETQFPDLVVLYKDEPIPKDAWLVRIVMVIIQMVGGLNPSFRDRWMNDISNALGTRYLLFPDRARYGTLTSVRAHKAYRHELVHIRDAREHPWTFYALYLAFPLPIGFSGRAHWEFRGYAQQLIVKFEDHGEIRNSDLDWVQAHFTSGLYLWMWVNKKGVRRRLETLRNRIVSGEYSGYYPEIGWYKNS